MWRVAFLPACAGLWNYATSLWLHQSAQPAEWLCAAGATAFAYRFPKQQGIAMLGLLCAIIASCWLVQARQFMWILSGCCWWLYGRGGRRIWWLKPIMIAVVWVTATFPVTSFDIAENWPLMVGRFGLVWALAIGYDVIDWAYDRSQGVTTWALRMGGSATIIQAVIIIWSSYGVQWAFLPPRGQWAILISLLWASVILFRLYHHTAIQAESDIFHQKMALDTAMLIQAVLMVFLYP
jgi:4-hydroxybenzoate polyprenyltransferase